MKSQLKYLVTLICPVLFAHHATVNANTLPVNQAPQNCNDSFLAKLNPTVQSENLDRVHLTSCELNEALLPNSRADNQAKTWKASGSPGTGTSGNPGTTKTSGSFSPNWLNVSTPFEYVVAENSQSVVNTRSSS